MPLAKSVWFCYAILIVITIVLMRFTVLAHQLLRSYITLNDVGTFVFGAVFQQGTELKMPMLSIRIIVLTTFLAALALFISYSGGILALIQSPSQSIRTLDDLMASPLEIAVQDTGYTRYNFLKENESVLQRVYKEKIEPHGDNAWIPSQKSAIAIERVRVEFFAFLIDTPSAYRTISKTYTESEKCSLSEIHVLRLPMLTIPVERNSPYKELFKRRYSYSMQFVTKCAQNIRSFIQYLS